MSTPTKHRHARGFSLLEVIAALAIAAALVLVAGVSFRPGPSPREVKSVARETAAALRRTRASAIAKGQYKDFIFDLSGREYRYDMKTTRVNAALKIEATVADTVQYTGEGAGDDTAVIRFFPNGSSTGGVLSFQSGNASESIRVDWATGRVRSVRASNE
ncbi:MAG: GspH/FimT family pseudopilin [Pseudomonadota bacterium]